jgi:hypothetical protein
LKDSPRSHLVQSTGDGEATLSVGQHLTFASEDWKLMNELTRRKSELQEFVA